MPLEGFIWNAPRSELAPESSAVISGASGSEPFLVASTGMYPAVGLVNFDDDWALKSYM